VSDHKYRTRTAYEAHRVDEKLGRAAQMRSENETDWPAFDTLSLTPLPPIFPPRVRYKRITVLL